MVTLLDNKLVKLEIMPGTPEFQEAQKIAKYQGVEAAEKYAEEVHGRAGGALAGVQKQAGDTHKQLMDATEQLPDEQKQQAQGALGTAANVGTGVVTTLGGTVKGVGDTLGNTVFEVGKGLTGTVVNTGSGLATAAQGKPQAAAAAKQQPAVKPEVQPKAESTQKNAVEPQLEDVEQGEGEEEDESGEKKGPRKIEIRSGAEPSAPADDLVDSVGKPAE